MRERLKKDYILKESYIVRDVIGEGASCIAYEVEEKKTSLARVLKEFYPISVLIERNIDGSLIIDEKQIDEFNGKKNHFEESIKKQILLKKQKGLINQTYDLYDSFNENNTFYVVEPYFEGKPYTYKDGLSLYDRICVCTAVAKYVEKCHSSNYLCLDIKPENIFVPEDNRENPMFFDFDSMREKDGISFGYSSYTHEWAAPEQIIPSNFKLISEATDVYSLGELVFWSVFDRHSRQEEQRRVSNYNFKEDTQFYNDINSEAEEVLSNIFHNTIRSSIKNRFNSVKELINELEKLKRSLYPKEYKIKNPHIEEINYFVGRENELEEIEKRISENHKVIITGIGGVGKSHLAKKYFNLHRKEYKNVLFLSFSIGMVNTIIYNDFISGIERKREETDTSYCNKKISALEELINGNSLIVIDNINIEFEKIDDKELLKRLFSLPADFLITSRCNQPSYSSFQMNISTIDIDNLFQLYKKYCPFSSDNEDIYVKKIAEMGMYHTLFVELIAKQAKNLGQKPEETYNYLKENGLTVQHDLKVKWELKDETISEHFKQLFNISNIGLQAKLVLAFLAFFPEKGVRYSRAKEIINKKIWDSVIFLIDNGWVEDVLEGERVLKIHPVISSVIIDEIKGNELGEKTLNSYSKILKKSYSCFEEKELSDSVAYNIFRYDFKELKAANYLTRFVELSRKYSDNILLEEYVQRAIDIYNQIFAEEYAAVREKALILSCELKDVNNYFGEIKNICDEHIKISQKNKDDYFCILWRSLKHFSYVEYIKNSEDFQVKDALDAILPVINVNQNWVNISAKRIIKKDKIKDSLKKLNYDYLLEDDVFFIAFLKLAENMEMEYEDIFYCDYSDRQSNIYSLRKAISMRKYFAKYYNPSDFVNNILILFDKSRVYILSAKYSEAIDLLNKIIENYQNANVLNDSFIVKVHEYIAECSRLIGDYYTAINEYKTSMEIREELGISDSIQCMIMLARMYLYSGNTNEGKKQMHKISNLITNDIEDIYRAGYSYNKALIYITENPLEAKEAFSEAKHLYFGKISSKRGHLGYVACLKELSKLMISEKNKSKFINAYNLELGRLEEKIGKTHPDVKRLKE